MKIIYKGLVYECKDNPIKGGVGDCYDEYDPVEMEMGIAVEMEHIGKSDLSEDEKIAIARDIARDHLKEIPDYYTRLKKMEKSANSA